MCSFIHCFILIPAWLPVSEMQQEVDRLAGVEEEKKKLTEDMVKLKQRVEMYKERDLRHR